MGKSAILFFFISLFVPQVIAMPKDQNIEEEKKEEEKKAKKIIKPPQFIPSNVQHLYRSDIIRYFTINNKKLDINLDYINQFLNIKYLEDVHIECRSIDSKALTVLVTLCKNLKIKLHDSIDDCSDSDELSDYDDHPKFFDVLCISCKDSELKNLENFSFSFNNSDFDVVPTIEFLNGIPCNLKEISLNNLVLLKFPKGRSLQNMRKFYWNNLNMPPDSIDIDFLKLDGFKELFPNLDEVAIEVKTHQSVNPFSFLKPFSTVEHVGLAIHMDYVNMGYDTMHFESYRYPINCEKDNIQLPLLFEEVGILFKTAFIHLYRDVFSDSYIKFSGVDPSIVNLINMVSPRRDIESCYFNQVNDLEEYLAINQKKETKFQKKETKFDTNSWFRFSLESTKFVLPPIKFTSSNVPQKISDISRYEPELGFKPYGSENFSLYNDECEKLCKSIKPYR